MFWVRPIETVISIGSTQDNLSGMQFGEFILHCVQGEKGEARQLAHIEFLSRVREKQSQDLGPDCRKQ
jgi:hypothetical protein